MDGFIPLEDHLAGWSAGDSDRAALVELVIAISGAGRAIGALLAQGPLAGDSEARQSALPGKAVDIMQAAISKSGAAYVTSEHLAAPIEIAAGAPFAVTLDNFSERALEAAATCGTIFSIMPAAGDAESTYRQPGTRLLAAGYFIYGPHVALVLTLGQGTNIYTLDPSSGRFRLTRAKVEIPRRTREFEINASNSRHWSDPVRAYIADCISGAEGPRGEDYNMRWTGSLVGACHRILSRGGLYLYPSDDRPGLARGRLHLVPEASPMAFIIEQAHGLATNGVDRILDIAPSNALHRTPLVFGSRNEVERIVRYKTDRHSISERQPLFGQRGLFRT